MTFNFAVLALLDGIAYASLLFLVAVGLTLIFGVLGILNIAHGSLYAIGAYVAATMGQWLVNNGYNPWLTYPALLAAAILTGVVLGGVIERFLLQKIYNKEPVLQLLVTFAVFMILENLQRMIWGVQPYYMSTPLTLLGNVSFLGINYTVYQVLFLPFAAILVLLFLRYFLRHTNTGSQILAVTEDREAATAIGINATRVYLMTFVIGACFAALGGALATPTTSLVTGMGANMIVLSFAVAATAGLGQIEGAAISALMIGIARAFAVHLSPELEVITPYLIMVLVLLVKPNGLFGKETVRKI
ncbi:branched-chain amino acid ABC transporter permease [Bacillus subtilis]|uniref:branched-chain amino acid ABC transporter permease n=1 Tax=Pseudochrobactrum asaccharolyticum TaxID=354351 RepID=UPI001F29790E|nr:branched-chain amino acid ABC transporter permease [Pseudochrobactrum asaccharolyticum]MCF7645579.1 branched-chain amino acid ABC transporter permease [Pseudochrobactrum asaccharolyticum]MCF7672194.1 branched-chain amino acid ABC transporter permease [Bacillus subtilis]